MTRRTQPPNATKASGRDRTDRAHLQAYVGGQLLGRFREFRDTNELTDSGAVRLLLETGLSFHDGLRPDLRQVSIREGIAVGQAKFFEIVERAVQEARG